MKQNLLKQSYSQQLADILRKLIQQGQGQWQCGKRVPAIRELAAQYSMSPNVVRAALDDLQHEGLILRKPRSTAVVNPDLPLQSANGVGVEGKQSLAVRDQR